VVALDEAHRAKTAGDKSRAARIVSLAPGVIDTDMQAQLRAVGSAGFPDKAHFEQLHAQGQLVSAEETARRVLAHLARDDFGSNAVADIRLV
jgi:NAD(P)-dependent dehydrogenase (short-subunit alcohol dehydrogenase family)